MKLKAVARLFGISAVSLLLTGCEIPTNLEEFLGWRDKFFLDVTPDQIAEYLGPLISLLGLVAFLSALASIAVNHAHGRIISAGYITAMLLLFSLTILFVFIPITTDLGEKVLSPELTADYVLKAMHWELTADLGKMVTATWAVSFTLLIPLITSYWQIVMLIMAFFALSWSIIGRSLKGLAFIVGEVFGWLCFLAFLDLVVRLFGENYPNWDFVGVSTMINVFYVGVLLISLCFCYLGIPFIAAILAPDLRDVEETKNAVAQAQRSHDWSNIPFLIPPLEFPESPPNKKGNGKSVPTPDYPPRKPSPYREYDPVSGELIAGYPELPEGGNGGPGGNGNGGNGSPIIPEPNEKGRGVRPIIPDSASSNDNQEGEIIEGEYKEYPYIPQLKSSSNKVLNIACDECGGHNPITESNCKYCGAGLNEEKIKITQNQSRSVDSNKQKVETNSRVFDAVGALVIPGMSLSKATSDRADTKVVDRHVVRINEERSNNGHHKNQGPEIPAIQKARTNNGGQDTNRVVQESSKAKRKIKSTLLIP